VGRFHFLLAEEGWRTGRARAALPLAHREQPHGTLHRKLEL